MDPIDFTDLCNLTGCAVVIAIVFLVGVLSALPWIVHHVRII